ncbi:DUF6602 domain-containing protein [Streptomyces goshikiensis]|uniref:DUF6602 domain-containing protein n=1 Tax=Streptomyces goshikiensis TaxID=1942 RepID=UPI0037180C15
MNHNHELHTFLRNVTQEMSAEYERIFRRTKEDPGTAGDEGESNWASLLSDWLPADVHVATKGRILAADGTASPQVDVVVLAGDYPRKLRYKKLYLAGGVLAAFECKNTLRKNHLEKFFATAQKISKLKPVRFGNFYSESHSAITYGLLAHSHEWPPEKAAHAIDAEIKRLHLTVDHPRELPAVISVSDLHTWELLFSPLKWMDAIPEPLQRRIEEAGKGSESYVTKSMFMRWLPLHFAHMPEQGPQVSSERPNPIGELLLYLLRHLANKDYDRSGMAAHYREVGLSGGVGTISARYWDPSEVYGNVLLSILGSDDWSRLDRLGNHSTRPLP